MTDLRPKAKLDRPRYILKTKSVGDIVSDLRKAEAWLLIAAIAAFLASAFFVVKYFVGGEMRPEIWTTEQWMNAGLGLSITAVITAAQAFLYAGGYKGHAAIIATLVVVFFGLFSEISQSMEREDATVRLRSESSAVFQAALKNINYLTSNLSKVSPEQQALSEAQSNLQYWQQLKAQKNAEHRSVKYAHSTIDRYIAQYQREMATLKSQISMLNNNRNMLLTGAIQQAKALEYDEDKHYAMIRLIQQGLGVTGIWASFLFSVIIIGTFEYAFHFVGTYVADHKKALRLIGRDAKGEVIKYAQAAEDEVRKITPRHNAPSYPSSEIPDQGTANLATSPQREQMDEKNTKAKEAEKEEIVHHHVSDTTHERAFQLILAEVRHLTIQGKLRPTVRPVTDAVSTIIKKYLPIIGADFVALGKPQKQKIAESILLKLAKEGVIVLNDNGGVGKAKYLVANRYRNKQTLDDTALKQAMGG